MLPYINGQVRSRSWDFGPLHVSAYLSGRNTAAFVLSDGASPTRTALLRLLEIGILDIAMSTIFTQLVTICSFLIETTLASALFHVSPLLFLVGGFCAQDLDCGHARGAEQTYPSSLNSVC